MKQINIKLLSLTFVILLISISCTDQYKGAVEGVVSSEMPNLVGTPIPFEVPEVTVEIHSLKTGETRTTVTDENGYYFFDEVPFGLNKVKTYKEGFETVTKYADVENNQTTRLDIKIPRIPPTNKVNLFVRVENEEGEPIASATVDVYKRVKRDMEFQNFLDYYLETGYTNENGYAYFFGLFDIEEFKISFLRIDVAAVGYLNNRVSFAINYFNPNINITITMEKQN